MTDTCIYPKGYEESLCEELEKLFDLHHHLKGDLHLLKSMSRSGYVNLDFFTNYESVRRLLYCRKSERREDLLISAIQHSTLLLLNEAQDQIGLKAPLPIEHTYFGKLSRTVIAYNLPLSASINGLKEQFQTCGQIDYFRMLKKYSQECKKQLINAVLKPPVLCSETYALVEYAHEEMAQHAVLTLNSCNADENSMVVVLFDGTNCSTLKEKLFPSDSYSIGRGRSSRGHSASVSTMQSSTKESNDTYPGVNDPNEGGRSRRRSSSHMESVGQGLNTVAEGNIETGKVFSIRGVGGLIMISRRENEFISFRLIGNSLSNIGDQKDFQKFNKGWTKDETEFQVGDYVSFTVGKNKKTGRKYASRVILEYRHPSSLLKPDALPYTSTSRRRNTMWTTSSHRQRRTASSGFDNRGSDHNKENWVRGVHVDDNKIDNKSKMLNNRRSSVCSKNIVSTSRGRAHTVSETNSTTACLPPSSHLSSLKLREVQDSDSSMNDKMKSRSTSISSSSKGDLPQTINCKESFSRTQESTNERSCPTKRNNVHKAQNNDCATSGSSGFFGWFKK